MNKLLALLILSGAFVWSQTNLPGPVTVLPAENHATANPIKLWNPAETHYAGFIAGALSGDLVWVLPLADSAGCLQSDGSSNLSFSSCSGSGGSVTSVTGTAPITSSGGTTPAIGCATCVTLAGTQTITGDKTFSGTENFTGNFEITGGSGRIISDLIFGTINTYSLGGPNNNALNTWTQFAYSNADTVCSGAGGTGSYINGCFKWSSSFVAGPPEIAGYYLQLFNGAGQVVEIGQPLLLNQGSMNIGPAGGPYIVLGYDAHVAAQRFQIGAVYNVDNGGNISGHSLVINSQGVISPGGSPGQATGNLYSLNVGNGGFATTGIASFSGGAFFSGGSIVTMAGVSTFQLPFVATGGPNCSLHPGGSTFVDPNLGTLWTCDGSGVAHSH